MWDWFLLHCRRVRCLSPAVCLRTAGVLFVVLWFACAESIFCIVHCHLLLPYQHHQHHPHHLAHTPGMSTGHLSSPGSMQPDHILGVAVRTDVQCLHAAGGDGSSPIPMPPSPIHELILVTITMLLMVMLIIYLISPAPSVPLLIAPNPPIPPPKG